jgi:uncharacterized protein (DUF1697 family)
LLPVRPQAFEQAPEERFVSRQACCPFGVSFSHEPLGVLLANCSVSRAVTHGHCLLPASGGLIGSAKVTMAELREVVSSLGHADVMTYIQIGNVLFTPQLADSSAPGRADAAALAAELERAVADGIGVRVRVVVLSREDLARAVRDNPFPGETNPGLLHAVFLPDVPGPSLAAWVADAERQVQETSSRDEARVLVRTVYLHTPDGYPRSELRRVLAKAGGPTSARVAGTARNWATVSKLLDLCGP